MLIRAVSAAREHHGLHHLEVVGFIMCRYEGFGAGRSDHVAWVYNVAFACKGAVLTCWVPTAEIS